MTRCRSFQISSSSKIYVKRILV